MSHPGGGSGTGPGGGSGTGPGRPAADISLLPTIGMVIRDGERLGAQLLALLNRAVDPASLPPAGLEFSRLEALREVAGYHVEATLRALIEMGQVALPPVGSAVQFPASQDPEALPRASSVATTGEPERPGGPPASGARSYKALGYLGPVMSFDDAKRWMAEARRAEPCNSPTPDGPCALRLGHPVGQEYIGGGHQAAAAA